VSVYKIICSSYPPRIKYGVNSGGYPEHIEKTGFPFSRLRAEALRRASTGMTKKEDYGIYGQTLIIYYSAIRHAPHGVHGSPEPYMVQGAFLNDSTGWSLKP
jgi:hypothetical protein